MRTRLSVLLCLGVLIFWTNAGWTQGQIGTVQGLGKAFDETRERRNKLISGEEQPTAADKKVAQAVAQWYIYRITFQTTDYGKFQKEFSDVVDNLLYTSEKFKNKNQKFIHLLGGELVECMKTVLASEIGENPTRTINACMMLPTMGRLKQDNVGDFLITLVSGEKSHDVIRLYALKGLKECLPIRIQPEEEELDINKAALTRKNLDVRYVNALKTFIDKPIKAKGLRPEELAVIHYLRREAITALAQAGAPAVLTAKKGGKLEGDAASTLLKVLADNALEPEPTLQEKLEAAFGLCLMKYPNMPEYKPEVALYFIGKTLVEFQSRYNEDLGSFAAEKALKKLPRIAWKVESKRFVDVGLKELAANTRTANARKNAETLRALATPILLRMVQYAPPDNAKANEFKTFVETNLRPKTGAVFTTPGAVVIPLP